MRLSLLAVGVVLASWTLGASVQAQPRARIVLFEDVEFQGEQRVVDGEVRDFRGIGFNDRASSIRVDSGTWQLCEDADFQGRCITLSRDDRSLVAEGFNDRISSARPVADRGNAGRDNAGGFDQRNGGGFDQRRGALDQRSNGGVILYQDTDFGGDSRTASDTVADFRSLRFNDTVSSIRIPSGTWQFCSDANFQGRCLTFDKDVPSLVPMDFNDTISSMRRVR
jgi:hypothetical protein